MLAGRNFTRKCVGSTIVEIIIYVHLFCLIFILEERLMRLPFLNHEMLVACLPMSPLWRPLGPRPRDKRSRPPGRLFTRHRSFTRPSLEGKLSPLWREDRSLNFIDASPPVKGLGYLAQSFICHY